MLRGEPWIAVIVAAVFSLFISVLYLCIKKKKGKGLVFNFYLICNIQINFLIFIVARTGMAGVPGTAHTIFGSVKDVGANVIMISQVP